MPDFPDKRKKPAQNGKASESMALEIRQMDRAESQANLARIAPERIHEPRCAVCTHSGRDYIEMMLAGGHGYTAIGSRVSPEVDRRSIANHFKKHMDLQDSVMRDVLEREAERIGQNHDDGVRDIVTARGTLEIMLRKGLDDVTQGITTVEPKDLVQISKILNDMDSMVTGQAVAEVEAMFEIFQKAIMVVCSDAQISEIGAEVGRLREAAGYKLKMEDALVVEAEVVPDGE